MFEFYVVYSRVFFGTDFVFMGFREEAQETVSLLEDSVKDVETERDELKAKVEGMLSAAEEKANVSEFLLVQHICDHS